MACAFTGLGMSFLCLKRWFHRRADNRLCTARYHDVKRDPTGLYKFTPPTRSTPLKYKEFLSLMRDKTRKGYVYFQDSLTSSSGPIVSEMKHFDYEWITGEDAPLSAH